MHSTLSNEQKQIVQSHLNDDGKLSCIKAFSVAKQIDIKLENMVYIANDLNIKIIDCELGVFGKKPLDENDDVLYEKIMSDNNMNTHISCKYLWDEAKKANMKKVRSTVQNSDIFTTHCQLGCFIEGKNRGKHNERKSKNLD